LKAISAQYAKLCLVFMMRMASKSSRVEFTTTQKQNYSFASRGHSRGRSKSRKQKSLWWCSIYNLSSEL